MKHTTIVLHLHVWETLYQLFNSQFILYMYKKSQKICSNGRKLTLSRVVGNKSRSNQVMLSEKILDTEK